MILQELAQLFLLREICLVLQVPSFDFLVEYLLFRSIGNLSIEAPLKFSRFETSLAFEPFVISNPIEAFRASTDYMQRPGCNAFMAFAITSKST